MYKWERIKHHLIESWVEWEQCCTLHELHTVKLSALTCSMQTVSTPSKTCAASDSCTLISAMVERVLVRASIQSFCSPSESRDRLYTRPGIYNRQGGGEGDINTHTRREHKATQLGEHTVITD